MQGNPCLRFLKMTISINNDIAGEIRNATEQFSYISEMAESNAYYTTEVTSQANSINSMVNEMVEMLNDDASKK